MSDKANWCDWCGRNAVVGSWVHVHGGWQYYVACREHDGYVGGVKGDRLPYRSPPPVKFAHPPKVKPVEARTGDDATDVKNALYRAMNTRQSAILNAERIAPRVLAALRVAESEGVAKAIDVLRTAGRTPTGEAE